MKKQELKQIIKEEIQKSLNKNNKNELVYAVIVNDGEYEQTIYIKNISNEDELKKIASSKTELKPKKIKIIKLGIFSELDNEEKILFKNNVAVFEPESID
jgi:hypothetical protein